MPRAPLQGCGPRMPRRRASSAPHAPGTPRSISRGGAITVRADPAALRGVWRSDAYIRQRRPECNTGVACPGVAGRARRIALTAAPVRRAPAPGARSNRTASSSDRISGSPARARGRALGVEYQVRACTDHRRRAHRRARRSEPGRWHRPRSSRAARSASAARLPPAGERARGRPCGRPAGVRGDSRSARRSGRAATWARSRPPGRRPAP